MSIVSERRVSSVTTKFGHVTPQDIRLVPHEDLLFIFLRYRVLIGIARGFGSKFAVILGSFMYTYTIPSQAGPCFSTLTPITMNLIYIVLRQILAQ